MIQREHEEGLTNQAETEVVENIEKVKQALAEEKQKAEGYLANWQRAQADFINYKRRSEQEKQEINQSANAVLMLGLLPILDDLERAFASIPSDLAKGGWVDGIKLIGQKLRASLEAQGLSQIKTVGEPFDPRLHQAVMQAEGKEGIIVEELQKGYRLYNKVLRPAMVVVGRGEIEAKQATESEMRDSE